MGTKVFFVGIGLSTLGLGYFIPLLIPASAIVVMVGVVMIVLDK
jgi:hypothetical protein